MKEYTPITIDTVAIAAWNVAERHIKAIKRLSVAVAALSIAGFLTARSLNNHNTRIEKLEQMMNAAGK
ncbi:MAG: hypothetical protein J6Y20_05560 [Lachnospiraceae bacterium]|nr:hypothetical protein [Lachnospiraceae bacterium]